MLTVCFGTLDQGGRMVAGAGRVVSNVMQIDDARRGLLGIAT